MDRQAGEAGVALRQICRKVQATAKKLCLPWGPRPAGSSRVGGLSGSPRHCPPPRSHEASRLPGGGCSLLTPFWFPGWIGSLCQALCEGPFHGLPTPTLSGGVWPPLPTVGSSACLGSEPRAPVSASGVPLAPPQPSPAQFRLDPAPGWQVRSSHLGILPSEGV